MIRRKLVLSLFIILTIVVSCNRVKTTPEIKETYADGKPKVVMEYTANEHGEKKLHKETHYFPGEKKYIEGEYDDASERHGVWTSWYENGQKNSQVKYSDGKEDGDYDVWHPNGKHYIKGHYKMGDRVGVWTFYDTLGQVTGETNFGKK